MNARRNIDLETSTCKIHIEKIEAEFASRVGDRFRSPTGAFVKTSKSKLGPINKQFGPKSDTFLSMGSLLFAHGPFPLCWGGTPAAQRACTDPHTHTFTHMPCCTHDVNLNARLRGGHPGALGRRIALCGGSSGTAAIALDNGLGGTVVVAMGNVRHHTPRH